MLSHIAATQTLIILVFFIYLQFPSADCLDLKTFYFSRYERAVPNKCIKNLIINNFSCGKTITVVYNEGEESHIDSMIKQLNEELCYNIITRNFDRQYTIVLVNELYVFISLNIREFATELATLTNDTIWNPKASFIIHIHNVSRIDNVIQLLSTYNIYDAVLIQGDKNNDTILYTFYPFAENSCGDSLEVVRLGKCDDNVTVSKCFTNKIPRGRDRNKSTPCKIRIKANENIPIIIEPGNEATEYQSFPCDEAFQTDNGTTLGIEQYILKIIAEYENFELEYNYVPQTLGFGRVFENGTSTGLLTHLQDRGTDLAGSGIMLVTSMSHVHSIYDYIYGHSYTGVYFLVAAARKNDWEIVYKEFPVIVWILIIVFYFLIAIFFLIFKILSPCGAIDLDGIMLKLWGYLFGNTNSTLSMNLRLRKLLVCWIWFTFFISNFYITAFSSLMTVKVPQQIRTGKPPIELYKPCIAQSVRIIFQTCYAEILPENPNKNCDAFSPAFSVCALNPDLYCIILKHDYLFQKRMYVDDEDEGKYELEAWEYSTLTLQAMYVRKGYAFKEILQRHTSTMVETGLLHYHEKMINSKVTQAVDAEDKMFRKLEFSAIRVAFYVLFFGEGVAFICFLGEHYKYYYSKKRANCSLSEVKSDETGEGITWYLDD